MIRIDKLRLELIESSDNILLVDPNSDDLENAYILCDVDKKVRLNNNDINYHGVKVIASSKEIKGLPILDIEEDEEILIPFPAHQLRDSKEIKTWMDGYEYGFKNAKKELFSLKDMKKIAQMAFTVKSNNDTLINDFEKWFDYKIKGFKKNLFIDADIIYYTDNFAPDEKRHPYKLNLFENKLIAYWK